MHTEPEMTLPPVDPDLEYDSHRETLVQEAEARGFESVVAMLNHDLNRLLRSWTEDMG